MKFTFGLMMAMLVVLGLVCTAFAEDCSQYGRDTMHACRGCCRDKGMKYKRKTHAMRLGCVCIPSNEPANIYVPGRDNW